MIEVAVVIGLYFFVQACVALVRQARFLMKTDEEYRKDLYAWRQKYGSKIYNPHSEDHQLEKE